MFKRGALIGATVAMLLLAAEVRAEDKEREPSAEIEIGAVGDWGLTGASSFGPSAAIQFTPIKDWLEIELAVSPLFGGGRTEWGTELVFYKSLFSFDNVEISFGVGPEWQHRTGGGVTIDSVSVATSLDFQIWQLPERRFGWFVEPSYNYSFGNEHEQSLGVTLGLVIAIP